MPLPFLPGGPGGDGKNKLTRSVIAGKQTSKPCAYVGDVPIVLQKSKIEEPRIFRENLKRESVADSPTVNRVILSCTICCVTILECVVVFPLQLTCH